VKYQDNYIILTQKISIKEFDFTEGDIDLNCSEDIRVANVCISCLQISHCNGVLASAGADISVGIWLPKDIHF